MPPADGPWTWDPTLYAGAAAHYTAGRVGYPPGVVDSLVAELALDGTGRLVDIGCGPGSLTLLLAPHVAEAVGVDADADMLGEAARLAHRAELRHVVWRHLRAEDLPADVPPARLVTFAQSFHWTDRPRVAAAARQLVEPGGALVHVGATTHRGVPTDVELPHPAPPWEQVDELVRRHLGASTRAGQSSRPAMVAGSEDAVYRTAGFSGPRRLEVPGRVEHRTTDQLVASVHSLSSAAPHLFGDRLTTFDAELRALLGTASPSGSFSEQMRSITLGVWR